MNESSGTRRARATTRAFSLVETVFAGFVLVVAALGLASSMAQGGAVSEDVRSETVARQAMRNLFTEIRATPFDQVANLFHDQTFAVDGLNGVGTADPGSVRFFAGPGQNPAFYTVVVTIRWQWGARIRETSDARHLANVRGDTGTPKPSSELERHDGTTVLGDGGASEGETQEGGY